MRNKTNSNITNCLENMHQILIDKKNEIDKMIEKKKKNLIKNVKKMKNCMKLKLEIKNLDLKIF
jgi:hypothetical protein